MRNLKLHMNMKPEAGGISDFQLYIMREREAYLKNLNDHSFPTVHDYSHDAPPLSMSQIKPSYP